MKVKYVENDKSYLIANHGVAKNAIFRSPYFKRRLQTKIKIYLSPLCEIISVVIHGDQFQVLVNMKSREDFENYYIHKKTTQGKEVESIPESTYIFSQAMANLQSSIAIHFNRKENRTGAVFARRFSKIRIRGEDEMSRWKRRLAEKVKLHSYWGKWSSDVLGVRRINRAGFKKVKIIDFSVRLQGRLTNCTNLAEKTLFSTLAPP